MESLLPAQSGEVLPNSDLLLQNDGTPTSRTPVTPFINIYFLSETAMRLGGPVLFSWAVICKLIPLAHWLAAPLHATPPHRHPAHHGHGHTIPPPGHSDMDLCLLSRASELLAWWLMIAHRSVWPVPEHIPV